MSQNNDNNSSSSTNSSDDTNTNPLYLLNPRIPRYMPMPTTRQSNATHFHDIDIEATFAHHNPSGWVVRSDGSWVKAADKGTYLRAYPEDEVATKKRTAEVAEFHARMVARYEANEREKRERGKRPRREYCDIEAGVLFHGCNGGKAVATCPDCRGNGRSIYSPIGARCSVCEGQGVVYSPCRKCDELMEKWEEQQERVARGSPTPRQRR